MTLIAPALQGFFTDRLIGQRNASPHTVAAYRDTFRLLLSFASGNLGTSLSQLRIDDLGPTVIAAFLNHLELERGNSVDPQRAAGGHPFAVPLCGAAAPRPCGNDPASSCDPA